MKTILCPTDFSANSENAMRYALALNQVFKAKIILLHTFETPVLYSNAGTFTSQLDYKVLHDAAAGKLKFFHKKIFGDTHQTNVEIILQHGLASSRICEIAGEKKADMILMGATGTGTAERMIIGSNAVRVSKHAPCKVMLIPGKAKFKGLSRFVYATDLSDDNLIQARELFPLAKKLGSELMFLYIDNPMTGKDDNILEKVTQKIKKIISYSKKSGYVCDDPSVSDGVDYFLKKHEADCLVLFHRHRNIFQAIYKPSISKKIALHASVPVMLLHENEFIG